MKKSSISTSFTLTIAGSLGSPPARTGCGLGGWHTRMSRLADVANVAVRMSWPMWSCGECRCDDDPSWKWANGLDLLIRVSGFSGREPVVEAVRSGNIQVRGRDGRGQLYWKSKFILTIIFILLKIYLSFALRRTRMIMISDTNPQECLLRTTHRFLLVRFLNPFVAIFSVKRPYFRPLQL